MSTRIPWSPEDVALITRWCRDYPKPSGYSFDWRRAKAEDTENWNRLVFTQNRKPANILHKGEYIMRTVFGHGRNAGGKRKAKIRMNAQAEHFVATVQPASTQESAPVAYASYCPNCGCNLKAVHAAVNLKK